MDASRLEDQLRGSNIFYTSSIHLVAFLRMKGVKPEGITKFKTSTLFLFEKNDILQEYLDAYKSDEIINLFLKNLREVKEDMLH